MGKKPVYTQFPRMMNERQGNGVWVAYTRNLSKTDKQSQVKDFHN